MKRTTLALTGVLLVVALAICGCGGTTTITVIQTQIQTVTGPVTTQTVSVTGPVTTLTQTATVSGPAITTTQTATAIITTTVTGPTTTTTLTKTGIVTQGITYVVSITPASPATLHFNDWVAVTVDYVITDTGGARIWAIPAANGKDLTATASYGAFGPTPPGKGTSSNLGFSIASGAVKVDQIHLLMKNSAGTIILFDAYITVDFTYGP